MTKKKRLIKRIFFGIFGTVVLFVLIVIINLIIVEKIQSIVTKGEPIKNYSEHKYALLIIDIQEATTGDVSMYPFFKKNSDDLIKNINRLIDSFKNQHIPVIYIRSVLSNPLINLLNSSYAKGSPGAKYDKRMKTVSGFEVIKKGKDSFRNTNLDSILISNKVSELFIVGLDAAECVNATVEAAQNRKYRVNLINEAILSKSAEAKDSILLDFKKRDANVISIDSLNILENPTYTNMQQK